MSLHHLGIAHLPVLHRNFSSPTPTSSTILLGSSPSQDLAEDNKDVLIERLDDLLLRLSDSSLEDGTISAIHTEVDRIETLLRDRGTHQSPRVGNESRASKGSVEDVFWRPLSPTRNISMSMRMPESRTSPRHLNQYAAQMSTQRAMELAVSAEKLASKLSETVAELQVRKEESDVSLQRGMRQSRLFCINVTHTFHSTFTIYLSRELRRQPKGSSFWNIALKTCKCYWHS